jgi:hypothetical protein
VFTFVERWHLPDSLERVRDVLVDLERYPEWWPQVIAVAKLGPDDARVLCRSVLPYTLDLVLHAVSRELPTVEVEIGGTLEGFARWTLTPAGTGTAMLFEQQVDVAGPMAWAARLAGPVGRWNHQRMMRGGRAGLERRLAQSR